MAGRDRWSRLRKADATAGPLELSRPTVVAPANVTAPSRPRPLSPFEVTRRRAARSRQILDAVTAIDATLDATAQRELTEWIRGAYEERGGGVLVGLFGRCYLGHPFVDHRMAMTGSILQHFHHDEPVPAPYAGARPLARSDAYMFIEVYEDGQLVPVRADGTSAV